MQHILFTVEHRKRIKSDTFYYFIKKKDLIWYLMVATSCLKTAGTVSGKLNNLWHLNISSSAVHWYSPKFKWIWRNLCVPGTGLKILLDICDLQGLRNHCIRNKRDSVMNHCSDSGSLCLNAGFMLRYMVEQVFDTLGWLCHQDQKNKQTWVFVVLTI